jgi:hypothetical protein
MNKTATKLGWTFWLLTLYVLVFVALAVLIAFDPDLPPRALGVLLAVTLASVSACEAWLRYVSRPKAQCIAMMISSGGGKTTNDACELDAGHDGDHEATRVVTWPQFPDGTALSAPEGFRLTQRRFFTQGL